MDRCRLRGKSEELRAFAGAAGSVLLVWSLLSTLVFARVCLCLLATCSVLDCFSCWLAYGQRVCSARLFAFGILSLQPPPAEFVQFTES